MTDEATPSVLPTPEERFERAKKRLRVIAWIAGILVLGLFAYAVWVTTVLIDVQDSSNDTAAKQETAVAISERADCRAAISSTLSEIRSAAANLDRSLTQQRAHADVVLFTGGQPSQEDAVTYSATETAAATAIRAVAGLPHLADAIDHGWVTSPDARATIPDLAARIAPCPKVS